MLGQCCVVIAREQGNSLAQLGHGDQAGAHAIVHVMGVVGNGIGQVAQLGLQRRLPAQQKALGHAAGLARLQVLGIGARAVLENALARLEAQVQAVKGWIALFQPVHHAQALQVVLEAAMRLHAGIERILARMAEGGVAQVVGQTDGLDQIFVKLQRSGHRAAQLSHFQRVRQAGAEQVALMVDEDLGLVDQAPEGRGMDDAVPVALEVAARGRRRLRETPPPAERRVAGIGGQGLFLHSIASSC